MTMSKEQHAAIIECLRNEQEEMDRINKSMARINILSAIFMGTSIGIAFFLFLKWVLS